MAVQRMPVKIRVESLQDGVRMSETYNGEMYNWGSAVYYRYEETDESMGKTMTTVKVGHDHIKLMRRGNLNQDQRFTLNQREPGIYEIPQGRMEVASFTKTIHTNLQDGLGEVEWEYELYWAGEYAGMMKLMLSIEKGEKQNV